MGSGEWHMRTCGPPSQTHKHDWVRLAPQTLDAQPEREGTVVLWRNHDTLPLMALILNQAVGPTAPAVSCEMALRKC
jgi:hypothetical protein